MSNQISLTIPNDDPIALRAFGNALEEMAVAHGAESRKTVKVSDMELQYNVVRPLAQGITEPLRPYQQAVLDTGADGEFVPFTDDDVAPPTQLSFPASDIDADGLPWDARIHSGNQERNADSTWRARRKPKDVTPEQWAEQVAQVRDELFALMAIPVADPVVVGEYDTESHPVNVNHVAIVTGTDEPESAATVFGAIDDHTSPAPLPPAPEPLPVPPAPAPLPPVTAPATGAIPTTMAEFMTSLTKYGPKDPSNKDECAAHVARVNEIVARHGLVSVGQLAKRLDLIPQVYADLVKELGQ